MYTSAVIQGIRNKSLPVSFRFEWAANDDEAFINEYIWMVQYGYSSKNQNFYNKIWSPGRLYYFAREGQLYPGDYWGR